MGKRILDFSGFKQILEAKKELKPIESVIENIDDILTNMFDKAKNVQYKVGANYVKLDEVLKGKKNPNGIKFEITKQDYNIGYTEPLNMDYTEGVLKKRDLDATLTFKDKSADEKKGIYTIEFDVKLDKVDAARLVKAKKDKEDDDKDDDKDEKDDLKGNF